MVVDCSQDRRSLVINPSKRSMLSFAEPHPFFVSHPAKEEFKVEKFIVAKNAFSLSRRHDFFFLHFEGKHHTLLTLRRLYGFFFCCVSKNMHFVVNIHFYGFESLFRLLRRKER
jgi:hypothetical protein